MLCRDENNFAGRASSERVRPETVERAVGTSRRECLVRAQNRKLEVGDQRGVLARKTNGERVVVMHRDVADRLDDASMA